jgi:hypothetical protein
MPLRKVDLLASWRCQFDSHRNLKALRMASFVYCGAFGDNVTPKTLKIL